MTDLFIDGQSGGSSGGGSDWLQLALDLAGQNNADEGRVSEGRRVTHLQLLTARPGQPVARVFGRMRIGGHIIWHGSVVEHISESGGDDGDKGDGAATPGRRDYRYSLSLAIALCEGAVSHIGRIWADGKLLPPSHLSYTLYNGADDAPPDPLIAAAMGADATPAFRGISYLLLRSLDVTAFGNRIPQLSFEVFCPLADETPPVSAVCLLPGASEFAYHPEPHVQVLGLGRARGENLTAEADRSDWEISLDQLQSAHPTCRHVALVVAWFGTDLRAGECRLMPKIDNRDKQTLPSEWQVAGLARHDATLVSAPDNIPAFGGTPSDGAVSAAIRDLHRRGLKVMFYPFIMMDVPPDNQLPDPHNDGAMGQPAYPWRGRITCYPASAQGTRQIDNQLARFVNGHGDGQPYDGLFCLRGMVHHYARLCAEAGGVESFLLASELPALSRLYNRRDTYPLAEHLVDLAREVRAILPDTQISYAADWTEYGAHVRRNGDVDFPLDAFWADANCDFIGIDNYLPLSDWRDEPNHADSRDGAADIYDAAYLSSNLRGGEYFDWYYRSPEDRQAQNRTPINDGGGEPWLFRAKDIRGWWENPHRPRYKNEKQAATAWQPAMKPIRFTELGCPAVDKGANQPNVFPDRLSSEGGLPHFSSGARDDYMQTVFIRAVSDFYAAPENNPRSPVYGGPMLADDAIYLWAWDARPFPVFPYRLDVWRDGDNWHTGHWLNGRYASAPLQPLLRALAGERPLLMHGISGVADGYALRGVTSAAEDMRPLLRGFAIDVLSGEKHLRLRGRGLQPVRDITADDIIHPHSSRPNGAQNVQRHMPAEDKQPRRFDLHYLDAENDYGATHVSARHRGGEHPVMQMRLPLAMNKTNAARLAARLLYEARGESETLRLDLSPACLDIEIGDIIRHERALWRVVETVYRTIIELRAVRFHPGLYGAFDAADTNDTATRTLPTTSGQISLPVLHVLDLPAPALRFHAAVAGVPLAAAFATPWPGAVQLTDGRRLQLNLARPTLIGLTQSDLPCGPVGRWDRGSALDIELFAGALASEPEAAVLDGANRLAVQTPNGWEVLQFAQAVLMAEGRYRLQGLLRGQFGTDDDMAPHLLAGAHFVVLGAALVPLAAQPADLPQRVTLDYGAPDLPRDSYGWQQGDFDLARRGLDCLSPVHVNLRQPDGPAGDWRFSWIRRTRINGDDFNAAAIALGEAEEIYRVTVFADENQIAEYRVFEPALVLKPKARRKLVRADPNVRHWHIKVQQLNTSQMPGRAAIYHLPDFMKGPPR